MNKLKRYTMGRVTLAKTENASLQGAGIVERENGEFYRCADIDPLLESIGAGGVKGQLMRKELSDDAVEEIKGMAAIQLVNGKAELTNVREIAHAIARQGSS